MKKIFSLALAAAAALPLVAQEAEKADDAKQNQTKAEYRAESTVWPAFVAIGEYPASPDIVGLRLTLPCSTKQESVSGIDLGLWGRAIDFEGLQLNILRNDAKDMMSGFQVGLYNSIGSGELVGLQAGLFNEAGCLRGLQAGIINVAGEAEGFQVGVINRAETMHGFQVGLLNFIREAEVRFFPIVNVGF